MIEKIMHKNRIISIIIKNNFKKEGITFLTPNDYSQQLAYMNHPTGKKILPHVHNFIPRKIFYTQEVLFIKKGKIRVDLYDENQIYLKSRILETGDVILLAIGGHGIEILEETEIIEVKQGPYAGEHDKSHFNGISDSEVKLQEKDD